MGSGAWAESVEDAAPLRVGSRAKSGGPEYDEKARAISWFAIRRSTHVAVWSEPSSTVTTSSGFRPISGEAGYPGETIVAARRRSAALGSGSSSLHSRVPRGRRRTVRNHFSDVSAGTLRNGLVPAGPGPVGLARDQVDTDRPGLEPVVLGAETPLPGIHA